MSDRMSLLAGIEIGLGVSGLIAMTVTVLFAGRRPQGTRGQPPRPAPAPPARPKAAIGAFCATLVRFGERDVNGNIFMPGSIKSYDFVRNNVVPLLRDNDPTRPIGRARISAKADYVEAICALNEPMTEDAPRELGFGYRVLASAFNETPDGTVRTITSCEVFEVSLITPRTPLRFPDKAIIPTRDARFVL